jgi:protein-L-isoaspartate(D-aspartate) O-methyltransferase
LAENFQAAAGRRGVKAARQFGIAAGMDGFEQQRREMVERQLAARGISDPLVLAAMSKVPRERFVPPELAKAAHDDRPLPIGEGQTISQPYIVALMAEAAGLGPGKRVLEVGAGSGYAAAVLAETGAEVFAIERVEKLVEDARERLAALGYGEIRLECADGSIGWPEEAPFDAILVAAASPRVPLALKRQLAEGGRLVLPVGRFPQQLMRITRTGKDEWREEALCDVTFVPLIGEEGWTGDL